MANQKPQNTSIKSVESPSFERRALIDPTSVNAENRTFEVVYATETPVLRSPWFSESFFEVLVMEGMRTGRMDKGAPFLDNHSRFGKVQENVLGVIEEHWEEGGKRYARIKLSSRALDSGLMQDIADGILRNVSVGYRVYKYEETPRAEGEDIPTWRAVDWEALEVSAVPVGADENAVIRSAEESEKNTLLIQRAYKPTITENKMAEPKAGNKPEKTAEAPQERGAEATATTSVNVEAERAEAIKAERERSSKIYKHVELLGLERSFAQGLVNEGVNLETAMERALSEYEKKDPAKGISSVNATVNSDEGDSRRAMQTGAILARAGFAKDKLSEVEKEGLNRFRSHSLMDLSRVSLENAGVSTSGMDKMELAGRAISQSTSDLPIVLEGTIRRILLDTYMIQADTWSRFCLQGSVTDFRDHERLRPGSIASLDEVAENAEYKNKSIPDTEKEKNRAKTYGNTINVSRQMIVNDDLGYFARLAQMFGRAAARSIERDVYALLLSNSGNGPLLNDGVAMFDASRNNVVGSGGAPSVAQFDAMRVLMASQKDPAGNDFLDLRPSVGLFPLGLGGDARVVNDAQYDPDSNNKLQRPNKVRGLLNDIVDTPRLTGTPYYMFADVNDDPAIEVAFLDGQTTPYLEQEMGFRVDGLTWKIRLDYGVGGIGFRGVVKNPGA